MVGKLRSCVVLAALMTFILASISADAQASVLAYWRFEEGVADGTASGAGSVLDSVGTFHGNPEPTGEPVYRSDVGANPVPLTGATNNLSLEFDGAGDFVLAPDAANVLNPAAAFTVEFWMKAGAQVKFLETLVDKSHGFFGDSTGWAFQTQSSGAMRFAVGNGSSFHEAISPMGANVRDNMWHHIAGVFDSTATGEELTLYIDGVFSDSTDNGGLAAVGNNRDIEIGRARHPTDTRFYDGLLDEVRISGGVLAPSQFLNAAVPEPSGFVLLGMFGAGLFFFGRQRKQDRTATHSA